MGNLLYNHWGCKLIYRPLSYPIRSLYIFTWGECVAAVCSWEPAAELRKDPVDSEVATGDMTHCTLALYNDLTPPPAGVVWL